MDQPLALSRSRATYRRSIDLARLAANFTTSDVFFIAARTQLHDAVARGRTVSPPPMWRAVNSIGIVDE